MTNPITHAAPSTAASSSLERTSSTEIRRDAPSSISSLQGSASPSLSLLDRFTAWIGRIKDFLLSLCRRSSSTNTPSNSSTQPGSSVMDSSVMDSSAMGSSTIGSSGVAIPASLVPIQGYYQEIFNQLARTHQILFDSMSAMRRDYPNLTPPLREVAPMGARDTYVFNAQTEGRDFQEGLHFTAPRIYRIEQAYCEQMNERFINIFWFVNTLEHTVNAPHVLTHAHPADPLYSLLSQIRQSLMNSDAEFSQGHHTLRHLGVLDSLDILQRSVVNVFQILSDVYSLPPPPVAAPSVSACSNARTVDVGAAMLRRDPLNTAFVENNTRDVITRFESLNRSIQSLATAYRGHLSRL